ncbi:condensin-2 complex subunit D3-like [Epargyreus clarus]|uniref:condensin-2 complex subunit D3-like n=1 Tax=Epargyreus clarus TaxID=520877 RepID=UPI003C2DD0B5
MSQVVHELNKLQLDSLSDEWVDAIYDGELLQFDDIPAEYESVLECLELPTTFKGITKAIAHWLNDDIDSEEEKSWSFLSHQIQHRKLLALLAYYIDYGIKNIFTKEYRNNALLASQLYYKLLAVSGYKAYNIYHSQLFAHSLVCLNFPKLLCENDDKYFNTKELTHEVNSVIKSLKKFVIDLKQILVTLHLGPNDMNFEDILANFVDITGGAIVNKLNIDKIELANVSRVIYEMIDILVCDANREPDSVAIQLLFKCLLPKLVAASVDSRNANNLVRASYVTYSSLLLTKYGKDALEGYTVLLQHLCYTLDGLERAEVRTARVSLVMGLMSLLPRKAYRKFVKWLLKLSTTSKVSHRQIALEMLSKLLSNDPEEIHVQKEIPGLQINVDGSDSRQTPVSVDTVSTEDESSQELPPVQTENDLDGDDDAGGLLRARAHRVSHAELLRAVYERVHDVSSALRARALAILAECVDSPHEPVRDAIKELNGTGEVSRLMAVSARCVCDERAVVRRAAVSLLHRLLATSTINDLDEIPGNTSPASIPLANNKTNTDTTNEDDTIDNVVNNEGDKADTIANTEHCDEANANEANADINSDKTVDKGSTDPAPDDVAGDDNLNSSDDRNNDKDEANIDEDNVNDSTDNDKNSSGSRHYAMLVGACRDASIVVRVCAITALGELCAARPARAALAAFLCGPLHQLSDPETKVQELVVNLVEQLLITPLQPYNPDGDENELPWMFLAGIIQHNMRRHLQKACTLLHKSSNCINHRLVDVASTHLGVKDAARDLQCLVLLTSVARLVEYSDLDFLLNYYYKIDEDMQYDSRLGLETRDSRILALTLELCTLWSQWASVEQRTTLRERLVLRLADNTDYGCRTACASLAAHLEPNNLQWATELMQISERRALDGGALEEWVRAADLSLVAPAPPAPALLQLFLAALADPPPEWGDAQRGACVAGAGRLCVRARGAAAAAAPPLAALLRDAAAPLPARLNALRALADICTRYTCIVEPLLGDVCGCLCARGPAALRRGAVRAVTRLLLGGFLRLRTPLYYKYCALLADEDPDVREPAEYYVTCCLTVDAIYHHLVDCVLYYNSDESVASDGLSFDARQLIYDVMLQRMSLVQRLNAQCRFAREVLQRGADEADEADELPAALRRALLDTITLLCGPRMKLPRKPQNNGDADIDDLQERITTNIVSHKMKRTVAEVVVPAVLRLYARLRARGGQLAAYLVRLATDLLNDYRHEIEELIENDEELVERVQQFQATIGLEPSFGNARNLVTASAPPEPDTPRAPRKRPRPAHTHEPRKRALRI